MVNHLQNTMSNLFKKHSSFDSQQELYEQTVAGYLHLFPKNVDQLCLDLKMRLRDATRSRINLVLLKYANETNCKWLSKIGVSPANYLKVTLSDSNVASTFDETPLTASNPAINLASD